MSNRVRNNHPNFRFTESELEYIETQMEEKDFETLSDYIVYRVKEVNIYKIDLSSFADLIKEMNDIGNVLNEYVRKWNAIKDIKEESEREAFIKLVVELVELNESYSNLILNKSGAFHKRIKPHKREGNVISKCIRLSNQEYELIKKKMAITPYKSLNEFIIVCILNNNIFIYDNKLINTYFHSISSIMNLLYQVKRIIWNSAYLDYTSDIDQLINQLTTDSNRLCNFFLFTLGG